jgi:folate-binding protein YgfZ
MSSSCAFADLPLACILIKGGDVLSWLQGQLTQDVATMSPGETRQACLCSPTGQIQSVLSVSVLDRSVAVTLPESTATTFFQRFESTVFMEDVQISAAPAGWRPHCVIGPDSLGFLQGAEGWEIVHPFGFGIEGVVVWCEAEEMTFDLPLVSSAALDAFLLERGVPQFGKDIQEKTLPPELGERFLAWTASYSKGCYTGQEVLMRIHARGHTNKIWVALSSGEPLKAGSTVSSDNRANAGVVTSTAFSPVIGQIAGAMLQVDSAITGSTVRVRTEGKEVPAEVKALPLRS